jgi:hypothetical protein
MVMSTPEEVLDCHALLAKILKSNTKDVNTFFTRFIQDCWEKSPERAAGMFYPLISLGGKTPGDEEGELFAHLLADGLKDSVTYQVTAGMVRVMRAMWENNMAGKICRIDVQELPCESGFAWLDESWQLFDIRGDSDVVRAVSWSYMTAWARSESHDWLGRSKTIARPSARISLWSLSEDSRETGRLPEDVMDRIDRSLGRLTLLHTAVIPFNVQWDMPDEAHGSADSLAGLVHMLWMFLGMEIVAKQRHLPRREFRRRAQRSIRHGEVHVVLLRRLSNPKTGEDIGHSDVDWSCQWVVQGHWRHWAKPGSFHRAVVAYGDEDGGHTAMCPDVASRPHRHCLQCGGTVSWVKPYVKGPDGMPLKVSRTLMKLAR